MHWSSLTEERSVLVVTNRLGVFPVSTALALKEAGLVPLIALMQAKKSNRRSILETISEYGLGYTVERVVDTVIRKLWLVGSRRKLDQIKVREVAAQDWMALSNLAGEMDAVAVISASFSYRFPSSFIARQRVLLNLHPAPLPEWRGADPIYWMIRKGERVFGVTLHDVVDRLDEGAVYFAAPAFPRIRSLRGFVELSLSSAIRKNLGEWMLSIIRGDVVPKVQSTGSYWPLPTKKNQRKLL